MNIAIIGAGNVGKALGEGFSKAGHQVSYGARNPEGQEKSVRDAAQGAEVIVFAIPYSALEDAAKEIGPVGDKVLIDCTNPITSAFDGVEAKQSSGAEELAAYTGSSRVVKCFNTVGFNIMQNPNFGGTKASMLYCGDDDAAKKTAAQLAADLGFEPQDAGPLLQARWLEALAWLWISMAVKYGQGREIAFVLHKR